MKTKIFLPLIILALFFLGCDVAVEGSKYEDPRYEIPVRPLVVTAVHRRNVAEDWTISVLDKNHKLFVFTSDRPYMLADTIK